MANKPMTLTALRANIYEVVDRVIKTGISQDIKRNGYVLRIEIDKEVNKFENLKRHSSLLLSNPDDIISPK